MQKLFNTFAGMESITTGLERQQSKRTLITGIAIGASDGLTVPFALAAGLSSVVASTDIILLAGLVAVAAGSISMAVGGYFAAKEEMESEATVSKTTNGKVENFQHKNREEIKAFFANLGLSEEVQKQATEEVMKDHENWADVMEKYETGPSESNPELALKSALHIGLSYIAGGLVPLAPYLFFNEPLEALKVSAFLTLIFLFLFGWLKNRLAGLNPWSGALRASITGALAAGAAFHVARFFEA